MKVGEYLFNRLYQANVKYAFGIPGDFALQLYASLEQSPIIPIVTTHEPSAGFAADAYARLNGLGLAVVTYGAGALNIINPIAQAYAEKSPVIVVSGAPEIKNRNPDMLIHHRVKTFDTQREIFQQITTIAVLLDDLRFIPEQVEEVIDTVFKTKRPGYIEVPRDLVNKELPKYHPKRHTYHEVKLDVFKEAMEEIVSRINRSRSPVVIAGVELERFGLIKKLVKLVEKYNFPVATSIIGKAVFPEHHKNFIGTYMGAVGNPIARKLVEESDCLLILGEMITDTNTGLFTGHIKRENLIHASSEHISISHHHFDEINLTDLINYLLNSKKIKKLPSKNFFSLKKPSLVKGNKLTIKAIFHELSNLPDGRFTFITDVGDCLFGCVNLNADIILNPGYYASMGFGVPAALGSFLAIPTRKPISLVGDGGFQMTGVEISTLVRNNIPAVIIVINNGAFSSLEAMDKKRDYFTVHNWNYVKLAESLGARGLRVNTLESFKEALTSAIQADKAFLIEAVIERSDISETLERIGNTVRDRFSRKK